MVVVFVGNQNSVDVLDVSLDRCQPCQRLSLPQSCVNQESGPLRLQQRQIAGAPGRQYGHAQPDRFPQIPRIAVRTQALLAVRLKPWRAHATTPPACARESPAPLRVLPLETTSEPGASAEAQIFSIIAESTSRVNRRSVLIAALAGDLSKRAARRSVLSKPAASGRA